MKNKKISIISLGLHGTNENYGAVLQIYAFQEYLKEKFDAEVTVIDYYGLCTKNILFLDDGFLKRFIKNVRKRVGLLKKFLKGDGLFFRIRKNEIFISKNINKSVKYNYKNIDDAKFKSDVYIAESDVIWDPSFKRAGFDKTYFLNNGCFSNGKKIIYAASLGDVKFTDADKNTFKKLISALGCISVRESYASEYIEREFNRKVETLVDPTLLFDGEFYDKFIENASVSISKPYVLVYFPAYPNNDVIKSAEEYAAENNWDVLYLCRTVVQGKNTKIEYGIEDFLYCVKHAEAIFCDSFHGICFSVIYKKLFFAFARDDGRKIEDICKRFSLMDRLVERGVLPSQKINYEDVYEILYKERTKAYRWLSQAI